MKILATQDFVLANAGGVGAYYGAYSGRPAAGNAGRMAWFTDSPIPQLDDGAVWRNVLGEGFRMPEPSLGSTDRNVGTSTITKEQNRLKIVPQEGALAARARVTAFAASTTEFTVTAALYGGGTVAAADSGSGCWPVIYLRNSAGAVVTFGPRLDGSHSFSRTTWTADGATFGANTNYSTLYHRGHEGTTLYRVRADGTTMFYEVSWDGGEVWKPVVSALISSDLSGGAADHGFGVVSLATSGLSPVFCRGYLATDDS